MSFKVRGVIRNQPMDFVNSKQDRGVPGMCAVSPDTLPSGHKAREELTPQASTGGAV